MIISKDRAGNNSLAASAQPVQHKLNQYWLDVCCMIMEAEDKERMFSFPSSSIQVKPLLTPLDNNRHRNSFGGSVPQQHANPLSPWLGGEP